MGTHISMSISSHRIGCLPCVKIEVGGVNVTVIYCVHVQTHACLLPNIRVHYNIDILHTIADGGCAQLWHRNFEG